MNIEQSKSMSLARFLSRMGYEPVSKRKGKLWYLSPFRHESVPSFKVNPDLNAWYDFAEGKGGDIVDFVKAHQQVGSVSEALACIKAVIGKEPLPKQEPLPLAKRKHESSITLDSIGPVRSKALLSYLKKRGISLALAANRVQEAHYRCDGKKFFAPGVCAWHIWSIGNAIKAAQKQMDMSVLIFLVPIRSILKLQRIAKAHR